MPENERRKFLKASLASLAAATGVGLSGCRSRQWGAMCYKPANIEPMPDEVPPPESLPETNPAPEEPITPPTKPVEPTDEKAANREDLTEKLKQLGEEEPPKERREVFNAMCYSISR